jgi:hypothetical protein
VVAPSGARLLRLPRGTNQRRKPECISEPCRGPLATYAQASQPKGPHHLGSTRSSRGGLSARTAHPSSVAGRSLRRYPPKVGAECLNRARSDLCGGCAVMRIPTAIWIGGRSSARWRSRRVMHTFCRRSNSRRCIVCNRGSNGEQEFFAFQFSTGAADEITTQKNRCCARLRS